MTRTLAILSAAVCLATTTAPAFAAGAETRRTGQGNLLLHPYTAYERRLPRDQYRRAYVLTPGDYYRLRAMGFSPDEVFMIANASAITGYDTRIFADAIYRGMYGRAIAMEFGSPRSELLRVDPEWRTEAWADAAGFGDPVYRRNSLGAW